MNNIRDKFEAWAKAHEIDITINPAPSYDARLYNDDETDAMYCGWQAATEQSQKEIAEKDARIAELEAKLVHYDRWLSDGVYFTNEEYKAEVAREKVLVDLAKLTYGYLWHINAGLDAPAILNVTSITPEKCSHIVRKLWLDVLTKEQRGEGINKALEALANVRGEVK